MYRYMIRTFVSSRDKIPSTQLICITVDLFKAACSDQRWSSSGHGSHTT